MWDGGEGLTAQGPKAPSIGQNEHPVICNDDVYIIMCVECLRKMETTDKQNTLILIHNNFHQGFMFTTNVVGKFNNMV